MFSWFKRTPKPKQRVDLEKITIEVLLKGDRRKLVLVTGTILDSGMGVFTRTASSRFDDVVARWYERGFFQADDGVVYPASDICRIAVIKKEEHWEEYED